MLGGMKSTRWVFLTGAWGTAVCAVFALSARIEMLSGRAARERELRTASEAERGLAAGESAVLRERNQSLDAQLAMTMEERNAARKRLAAMDDNLQKAYRDIAEMEKQIVAVSRAKNDIETELDRYRDPLADRPRREKRKPEDAPAIEGIVLGVSDKVNLVLISVGSKDKVRVGDTFIVHRGARLISKLFVDKVDDQWAACLEMTDSHRDAIQPGDGVTTGLPR